MATAHSRRRSRPARSAHWRGAEMSSVPAELSIADKARLVAGATDYTTAGLPSAGLRPLRLADGGHGIGGFSFGGNPIAPRPPLGAPPGGKRGPAPPQSPGGL